MRRVLPAECRQLRNILYRQAVGQRQAYFFRRFIKGADQLEAAVTEQVIFPDEALAAGTAADENGGDLLLHAQDGADLLMQQLHIIAVALLAKPAKAVQVLPDLAGGDLHLRGQLLGGNTGHAVIQQHTQITVVPRQTPHYRKRNRFFVHSRSPRIILRRREYRRGRHLFTMIPLFCDFVNFLPLFRSKAICKHFVKFFWFRFFFLRHLL